MIRTRDLRKAYDGRPVLRGVSLSVDEGEIFGFVGPNGAGKTTFLKCLVGIVRADGGEIEVAGVDARRDSLAVRRLVGYSPGETALYHRMPAEELVRFAIAFHPHADAGMARELIERFDLPPRRKVGAFSHGMKRKLLLVQALASRAPVLLLDEPMEGLDPDARRQVEGLLREATAEGRTVFFSSHDLASVERVCDRVAFLRHGELLQIGTVSELLARASSVLRVTLREERELASLPQHEDLHWTGAGTTWTLEFQGPLERAVSRLTELPIAGIRDGRGGLEETFETLYGPEAEA